MTTIAVILTSLALLIIGPAGIVLAGLSWACGHLEKHKRIMRRRS